ncbi:hypothetical protein [Amycolatopsis thailandensis]|uniref:Uncharacterized protein n=1 Tax=Amycolatopsis thailandensis TaxID=589330 RepID=A0A229SD00_9PSEU|nr:hypothetical protein CFP71_13070 [Amycolatopsis thailandensis]
MTVAIDAWQGVPRTVRLARLDPVANRAPGALWFDLTDGAEGAVGCLSQEAPLGRGYTGQTPERM